MGVEQNKLTYEALDVLIDTTHERFMPNEIKKQWYRTKIKIMED